MERPPSTFSKKNETLPGAQSRARRLGQARVVEIRIMGIWAWFLAAFLVTHHTRGDLACDPCIDRSDVAVLVIYHGTGSDAFWKQVKSAAQTAESDLGINLDISLYGNFDPAQMAADITAVIDMATPPDALIVTVPNDAVHDAISTVVAAEIPTFGYNSGYDVAKGLGLAGFVGQCASLLCC